MSAAIEAYLARLYTDAAERERFLADRASALAVAGLTPDDAALLAGLDGVGLRLAADSFARKRAKRAPRRHATLLRRRRA